jgi:hypothetical protein
VDRDELREWERVRMGVLGRETLALFMLVDRRGDVTCDWVCFGSFKVDKSIQG